MLKLAERSDEKIVTQIITETFDKNPGVNWLLKKSGSRKEKIHRLAEFAFIKAHYQNGVFISDNKKGVAICYKFNIKTWLLAEFYYQLRFALSSISLIRLIKVLRRESYRKNIRPKSGEYLYFWFLGVLPEGEKAGFELRDGIFEMAKKLKLPV